MIGPTAIFKCSWLGDYDKLEDIIGDYQNETKVSVSVRKTNGVYFIELDSYDDDFVQEARHLDRFLHTKGIRVTHIEVEF